MGLFKETLLGSICLRFWSHGWLNPRPQVVRLKQTGSSALLSMPTLWCTAPLQASFCSGSKYKCSLKTAQCPPHSGGMGPAAATAEVGNDPMQLWALPSFKWLFETYATSEGNQSSPAKNRLYVHLDFLKSFFSSLQCQSSLLFLYLPPEKTDKLDIATYHK